MRILTWALTAATIMAAIVILSGIIATSSAQAQTHTLSGRITNPPADTGTPIPDVTVTLSVNGTTQGTTQTDNAGNFSFTNLTAGVNYDVTPSKAGYEFNPVSQGVTLNSDWMFFFTGGLSTNSSVQFSSASYSVSELSSAPTEADRAAIITVLRTGNLLSTVTVDYATSDGTANQRTDYTIASGTLRFGPNETSKSFTVLVTDDAYFDGTRTVNLTLTNGVGAIFGTPNSAVLSIGDNDTSGPTTNPIDDATFFVRQHYYDFLSRVPDEGGLGYWSSNITSCGTNTVCIDSRRVGVSAAFFIELEFQETGGFVYRFYKASYGVKPTYAQFMPDRSRVVAGTDLAAGKAAFAQQWVLRPEFIQKYPVNLSASEFVTAIINTVNTGSQVDLSSQQQTLINEYNTNGGRARVVQLVAENAEFKAAEYNKAFVLMQYFGYLRREPEQDGYDYWLNILNNREPNNFRGMVCAFIMSSEYQSRFSSVITRSDQLCAAAAQ